MAHIHTEPGHHDLTASAIVFRTDGHEPRILLHLHKRLNVWMHAGGHVELDETPWAAVVREVREELGYGINQLRLLQPPHALTDLGDDSVAHPQPFLLATYPYTGAENHYHTDTCFLFVTNEEPRHHVGADESEKLQLFTRNEVANLPPEQIIRNIQLSALYAFDRILGEWDEVDPRKYRTTSTVS